ncbi:hypothetical protein F5Y10DRAFT_271073 [Nemania abortiva]|nr:hypothetical protein F5Y10DRAFT_271073 [Nemania abortiva]
MDHSPILLYGMGENRFQFYSGTEWVAVDFIVDNGMNQGYSIYRQNNYVGVGSLVVYDEIDNETDILHGGPVAYGWVTNFPDDYVAASDDTIAHYRACKLAFRKYFVNLPLMTATNVEDVLAASVGRRIYKLAKRDPTDHYGLRETEKTSEMIYSVGFNGTCYRFPTISANPNYYYAILSGDYSMLNYFYPPTKRYDNDTPTNNAAQTRDNSS